MRSITLIFVYYRKIFLHENMYIDVQGKIILITI
jgi:hypothetical protein